MFNSIPIDEFKRRTGIDGERQLAHSWGGAHAVVSLRELARIDAIQLMTRDYVGKLLESIVLSGSNKPRAYEGCTFDFFSISPRAVRIGQTFVERSKYIDLVERFGSVLDDFCMAGGIGNAGSFVALGTTKDSTRAIAHYLPPIVEMNGDCKWNLLDGVHRNYLTVRTGNTLPVIAIQGVRVPFPCDLHSWDAIKPVDMKPALEDRYFNLKPKLFRDMKHVGIDG